MTPVWPVSYKYQLRHQPRMRPPLVACISRSSLVAVDFCVYTQCCHKLGCHLYEAQSPLWVAQGASENYRVMLRSFGRGGGVGGGGLWGGCPWSRAVNCHVVGWAVRCRAWPKVEVRSGWGTFVTGISNFILCPRKNPLPQHPQTSMGSPQALLSQGMAPHPPSAQALILTVIPTFSFSHPMRS